MSQEFLIKAINLGLALLSRKAFQFVSLLLTAGLFAWCMADPDYRRILAATVFGALSLMYDRADKPEGE